MMEIVERREGYDMSWDETDLFSYLPSSAYHNCSDMVYIVK